MKNLKISLLSILITAFLSANSTNYYVSKSTGNNNYNGTSSNTPWMELSYALNHVTNGDKIFVANGTYYPTSSKDRRISFNIPYGVEVLGGYSIDFSQRDFVQYETILSGDIGFPNENYDNSYNVVQIIGHVFYETIIDGFTIQDGYADVYPWNYLNSNGGGIHSIKNGVISNCIIKSNYAQNGGGGLHATESNISNCLFENNIASSAAAASLEGSSIMNSFVINNKAYAEPTGNNGPGGVNGGVGLHGF